MDTWTHGHPPWASCPVGRRPPPGRPAIPAGGRLAALPPHGRPPVRARPVAPPAHLIHPSSHSLPNHSSSGRRCTPPPRHLSPPAPPLIPPASAPPRSAPPRARPSAHPPSPAPLASEDGIMFDLTDERIRVRRRPSPSFPASPPVPRRAVRSRGLAHRAVSSSECCADVPSPTPGRCAPPSRAVPLGATFVQHLFISRTCPLLPRAPALLASSFLSLPSC